MQERVDKGRLSHFVKRDEHWEVGILQFAKSTREIFTPIEGLVLIHQPCLFSIPLSLEEVRNPTLGLRCESERLKEFDKILLDLIGEHSGLRNKKLAWAFGSKFRILLPRILNAQHFEEHGRSLPIHQVNVC
jgi:hypothetical protein